MMDMAPSAAARLAHRIAAAVDPERLGELVDRLLAAVALYLAALVLSIMALSFALAAAYIGLPPLLPPWAAALVVGGVCIGLAVVAWAFAKRRARTLFAAPGPREPLPDDSRSGAGSAEVTTALLIPLIDEAVRATRARPGETILTALAAGFVVGAFRR
jgi:drug/metabolite transporter (DMT)-like permease